MSEYTLAVKVFAFPDGTFQGSAMMRPAGWSVGQDAHAGCESPGTRGRTERPESRDRLDELNRKRSARRSRQLLIRHVRMQGFDCLGTLTFGGERLPSAYEALALAVDWYRLHGRVLLGDSQAAFVPEHGELKRRVHVHLGLRRGGAFWDYRAIVRSWSAFLASRGYESPGGTHRVHFSKPISARKLSRYLAKYLGKAMDEVEVPKGCHRFRSVGCQSVQPAWVAAVPSMMGLCGALGLNPDDLYPYRINRGEGSTILVGFGFDTGGG